LPSLESLHKNEMALLKVCADMESRGVLLNRPYVEGCFTYEKQRVEEARADFEKDTGRTYKDSSKLFAEIFTERGEYFPRTDKGNPSFAADFLDTCKSPTAARINKIRHHEKRLSTYFLNFLYYMDEAGYIHPSMNQAGTTTGRFSYSSPNLQNVPKEDEVEDATSLTNVRRCFVPPLGYRILAIDYSQQEYRLMLDYAGEERMIRQVLQGADIHQLTAELLHVSRKRAKTLNFMTLYGGGINKLALALDVHTHAAKEIREAYFAKLPKVARFIRQVAKRGEDRGFIFNRFGRRFWCSDYKFSYKLPNHLIQGTGADVIKHAMVQIHELLKGCKTRMVLQVHDELIFYLADGEEHLVPELRRIMENIYQPFNGMKLTTDARISSTSWAHWDLEPWKD
jgi:DNA polymerase-1